MRIPSLRKSVLLIRCALAVSAGALVADEGKVEHNEPESVPLSEVWIAIPATPSKLDRFAAEELRQHLQKASGIEVPVSDSQPQGKTFGIFLGESPQSRAIGFDSSRLKPDAFEIVPVPDGIVIAGRDYHGPPLVGFNNPWRLHESFNEKLGVSAFGQTGTLFGVYRFLEQVMGVRWYMPGELGTVVPRQSAIQPPRERMVSAPAFEHRHAYFGFFPTSDEDALWYRRAGFGTPAPVQITHSLGHFFLKYKESRPDFFALIDGERDFTNRSTIMGPGNFDLTNPDFVKAAVDEARRYFDANPEQLVFPLSPNDGMKRITDHPAAQSQIQPERGELGKFSNYVWGFVDRVAREVYKTHPDRLIGTLAYEAYTLPPDNFERLSPNVAVMYCKTRGNFTDNSYKERIHAGLKDWVAKSSAVYCWEYYNPIFDNSSWKGYPAFYPAIIEEDLRWLMGKTRGEFIEAESWSPEDYAQTNKTKINFPGLQHPNLYLTAKLLWDPSKSARDLLEEYYDLFYGPAAKPMRDFWETAEKAWMHKEDRKNPHQVFDSASLLTMSDALGEAASMAPPDSEFHQRISNIREEFLPVTKMQQRLDKIGMRVLRPKVGAGRESDSLLTWDDVPSERFLDRAFQPARPATTIQSQIMAETLHLRVMCFEPRMDALVRNVVEKDQSFSPAIWEDDSIEIFFSPIEDNDLPTTQIVVNANGAILDAHRLGEKVDIAGDSGAVISVNAEATSWTVDLAVPVASLPLKKGANTLRANFFRNRLAGGSLEQSSWAPLVSGAFFNPDAFGTIELPAQ